MINSVENKRLTEFDRKSQLEKGLFFRPFSGHFLTSNSRWIGQFSKLRIADQIRTIRSCYEQMQLSVVPRKPLTNHCSTLLIKKPDTFGGHLAARRELDNL